MTASDGRDRAYHWSRYENQGETCRNVSSCDAMAFRGLSSASTQIEAEGLRDIRHQPARN